MNSMDIVDAFSLSGYNNSFCSLMWQTRLPAHFIFDNLATQRLFIIKCAGLNIKQHLFVPLCYTSILSFIVYKTNEASQHFLWKLLSAPRLVWFTHKFLKNICSTERAQGTRAESRSMHHGMVFLFGNLAPFSPLNDLLGQFAVSNVLSLLVKTVNEMPVNYRRVT